MHLKVILKLKKPLKLSLMGKYIKNQKNYKKNKKPPGWVKKKPGFFPTLPGSGSATLLLRMFRCVFQFLLVLVGGSSQDSLSATISRLKLVQTKDQLP